MLIAQISDPHLCPKGQLLHGVSDANAGFSAVISALNQFSPQPDLVVLSGDLTEAGAADEYALAKALLADLRCPLRALPGNHDERDRFRALFPDLPAQGPLHWVETGCGPVRVVGLDVTVPGAAHGQIDPTMLEWLAQILAQEPTRPTLLVMHQPPILSGIPFMDQYRCFGGEGLLALLARFPSVETVACGHVHRAMQRRFGTAMLCTAPSLSPAIALRLNPADGPASLNEPPAMLMHHWQGDALLTHHLPLGTWEGPFPFF
jgi:3',5'-cyclic-AMP phosphodiesterase